MSARKTPADVARINMRTLLTPRRTRAVKVAALLALQQYGPLTVEDLEAFGRSEWSRGYVAALEDD
jgi:hypothetical protein